jgi:aminoglycoside phosphotransferase (APT) family kinase protein
MTTPDTGTDSEPPGNDVARLVRAAFDRSSSSVDGGWPRVRRLDDANAGRGVFSRIWRVALEWDSSSEPRPRPLSVIVKSPAPGPNGEAGRRSGAYRREAIAYRQIVPHSPVLAPAVHLIEEDDEGNAWFVMEDLGDRRSVDQLDGLELGDGTAIAAELASLHRHWAAVPIVDLPHVRRNTPATLTSEALSTGLKALTERWGDDLDSAHVRAFQRLMSQRDRMVRAFVDAPGPTICHGDPRADNLVFASDGRPVFFDWQQVSIQLGEADLAWLAATSFTVETRRRADRELIEAYGTSEARYRLGYVLPGLTVLLLAQREVTDDRSARFVTTSLRRIGTALHDLDVAHL